MGRSKRGFGDDMKTSPFPSCFKEKRRKKDGGNSFPFIIMLGLMAYTDSVSAVFLFLVSREK